MKKLNLYVANITFCNTKFKYCCTIQSTDLDWLVIQVYKDSEADALNTASMLMNFLSPGKNPPTDITTITYDNVVDLDKYRNNK